MSPYAGMGRDQLIAEHASALGRLARDIETYACPACAFSGLVDDVKSLAQSFGERA